MTIDHPQDMEKSDICCLLFNYLAQNPGAWALSAIRLKEAADVIRRTCWPNEQCSCDLKAARADFVFGPVYMLLMGMAVEAGLKAMLVAEKPELVEGQRIAPNIANHKLKKLWREAGLLHARAFDRLLERLETFVVFLGRYPVSRTQDNMTHATFHKDPDLAAVARVWALLEQKIKVTLPDLWADQDAAEDVGSAN